MKQILSRLRTLRLRQIITVFLATLTFLVVPAFNHSTLLPAQAESQLYQESPPVTADTVKRIQEKAEDLGDSPERPIGETGLKNIKKLGENIPETIKLNVGQQGAKYNPNEPNKMEGMEEAQQKSEK